VVCEGEPSARGAAEVGEASSCRSAVDLNPLSTTEEPERVIIVVNQPVPSHGFGDDPWPVGRRETCEGSPVGAYLVGAEVVGIGGQASRDFIEKFGGEGGPAAAGHRHQILRRSRFFF
jgi:hypothetical protein